MSYCEAADIVAREPRAAEFWPDDEDEDFETVIGLADEAIDRDLFDRGIDIVDTTQLKTAAVYWCLSELCWRSRSKGGDEIDTWRNDAKHYREQFNLEMRRPIQVSDDAVAPIGMIKVRRA